MAGATDYGGGHGGVAVRLDGKTPELAVTARLRFRPSLS